MAAEPIQYFDRYSRILKTERVYGGKWLHWAYGNPAGRFAVWLAIRRIWFSRWYGRKMKQRASALKILPFITEYELAWNEFVKSPFDYKTFNEFFCRALKESARPIAAGEKVAVFPADGRHLAFQNLDAAEGFYVKGAKFNLAELLDEARRPEGERPLSARFAGGSMLISRLCPVDYHRFHFPAAGVPGETVPVRGWLYSVSPVALKRNIRYLVENKRAITLLETANFGTVAMVEVGATNVGSIQQSFVPGRPVKKGEEKGFFCYGGSCVITLFSAGAIRLDPDVAEQSSRCVETFARMGDRLGEVP
jgi:phosphatidylserine decarboxylase